MRGQELCLPVLLSIFLLASCATQTTPTNMRMATVERESLPPKADYGERLPQQMASKGEKFILIDPNVHAWGAYDNTGQLLRSGLATAGGSWCPDVGRSCRTTAGTFRIKSLGSFSCKSNKYPLPNGGAPMPYCMYFNGQQGLHGSYQVVEGNVSHGCVRMTIADAEWVRFNFANIGTKVIVRSY